MRGVHEMTGVQGLVAARREGSAIVVAHRAPNWAAWKSTIETNTYPAALVIGRRILADKSGYRRPSPIVTVHYSWVSAHPARYASSKVQSSSPAIARRTSRSA